jgi:hypothetical protein
LRELASLDRPSGVQRRLEQQALRRLKLHGRALASCALCGLEFSADLLVAAHIKRRAACTNQERLDFEHNVMLLCLFGCDALFERKYLVVRAGRIQPGSRDLGSGPVKTKVTFLHGKPCAQWSEASSRYFAAHASSVAVVEHDDEDT